MCFKRDWTYTQLKGIVELFNLSSPSMGLYRFRQMNRLTNAFRVSEFLVKTGNKMFVWKRLQEEGMGIGSKIPFAQVIARQESLDFEGETGNDVKTFCCGASYKERGLIHRLPYANIKKLHLKIVCAGEYQIVVDVD